jgi:hypothetical protein
MVAIMFSLFETSGGSFSASERGQRTRAASAGYFIVRL